MTADKVWWGTINKPFEPAAFDALHYRMVAYFQGRDVYVQDRCAGADPRCRPPVRLVTVCAWHSLFVRTMFLKPTDEEHAAHVPEFTVIDAPGFHATPEVDETLSPTFILVNFKRKLILIGGTEYAGEMKKAIFSILNYLLPPIAKLTPEQAMYHFISGYTAKVAGTERGVKDPTATFSVCFGAPFMPLHPIEYAKLLREKLNEHGSQVWLINTGWTGGSYGARTGGEVPRYASQANEDVLTVAPKG